jgi:hypothetical protein
MPFDRLLRDTDVALGTLEVLAELPPTAERDHHLVQVGEVFEGYWSELERRWSFTRGLAPLIQGQG